MNEANIESKLEDVSFWCKSILNQPEDKNAIGYLYVHAQLLLDEIKKSQVTLNHSKSKIAYPSHF